MSYVNVLNFDSSNTNCTLELLSDLNRGKTFETLEDVAVVMKGLANTDLSKDDVASVILNLMKKNNVTPKPYIINGTCPVCGNITFMNNVDYEEQVTFCLVCNTYENQSMDWEEMRASENKVLIWNNHFNNKSVENIDVLNELLRDLKQGLKPDHLQPLVPKLPIFKDEYMNKNIIRPTMSEYKKYRNTMLRIISFSKNQQARILAKEIFRILESLNVHNKEVKQSGVNLRKLSL